MKRDLVLINHEKIHLCQQLELLIFFFYLWYFLEFFYYYIQTGNRRMAYRMIRFEQEAYHHEKDPDYLKTRKIFGFLKKH